MPATGARPSRMSSGTTRARCFSGGRPSGFSRLAAPAMRMAMRRATIKDLAALKRLLEA